MEYNPRRGEETETEPAGPDSDDPGPDDDCNGQDDDGDGLRDEESPDLDQNGTADCQQCEATSLDGGLVGDAPSCSPPPPAVAPWAVEVLWTSEAGDADGYGCRVTSVVDVDADGDADVLCASQIALHVLDGSTGVELWQTDRIVWLSPTSALDVDLDGAIDIVGIGQDGRAVVLDGQGNVLRDSNDPVAVPPWGYEGIARNSMAVFSDGGVPAIATPEAAVLGSGGDNVGEFPRDWDDQIMLLDHAVGDIDRDGRDEILTKAAAFSPDGSILWSTNTPQNLSYAQFPVLLQADSDAEGEVMWMSGPDGAQLVDADGTELAHIALPDPRLNAAMACVGDLDGDGWSEVVFSDYEYTRAWTPWGDELWAMPIVDVTGFVTCSTFDFDGDGAKEVVVGTQDAFYILDGFTGVPHFEGRRASYTGKDLPILADVDADGSVDIVMSNPSDYGPQGEGADVAVYSNKLRDWPPGIPYWPYESWSGVGSWPDGTPRDDQEPPWIEYNIWRGQPEWMLWGTDLRAEVVDACVAASPAQEAEVRLAVRLVNLGPQIAPAGTPLAIYRVKADGSRVLDEVVTLATALDPQTASSTWEIVSDRAEAAHGLAFVAGSDGAAPSYLHDCNESNNEVIWTIP